MTTPQPRYRISREQSLPWIEVAQSARILRDLFKNIGAPVEGSPLAIVDDLYPVERASTWCRSFLGAALEHLLLWADYAAPLKFHDDAVIEHNLRPAQTLARAALESASQAVWVLAAKNPPDLLQRHFVLILHDLDEQRKAAIKPEDKAQIKARDDALRADLLKAGLSQDDLRAKGYMELIKYAAAETAGQGSRTGLISDPAEVERAWRASAGAAHGKRWPALELTVPVDGGRTMPDPTAMSNMLKLADAVTAYGVARFADYSGHEPQLEQMLADAAARLLAVIPHIAEVDGAESGE